MAKGFLRLRGTVFPPAPQSGPSHFLSSIDPVSVDDTQHLLFHAGP